MHLGDGLDRQGVSPSPFPSPFFHLQQELSQQMLLHKHMSAQNANSSLNEDCQTLKSALDEIVQLFVISYDTPLTTSCQCSPKRPPSFSFLSPSALNTPVREEGGNSKVVCVVCVREEGGNSKVVCVVCVREEGGNSKVVCV